MALDQSLELQSLANSARWEVTGAIGEDEKRSEVRCTDQRGYVFVCNCVCVCLDPSLRPASEFHSQSGSR